MNLEVSEKPMEKELISDFQNAFYKFINADDDQKTKELGKVAKIRAAPIVNDRYTKDEIQCVFSNSKPKLWPHSLKIPNPYLMIYKAIMKSLKYP